MAQMPMFFFFFILTSTDKLAQVFSNPSQLIQIKTKWLLFFGVGLNLVTHTTVQMFYS